MGAGRGGRSARPVERRRFLSAGGDVSLIQQIRHVLQMPHPQPAELLAGDFPDSLPTGGRIVAAAVRSEEHTSELRSLMRISYAVVGLKKKNRPIYSISSIH